MSGVRVGFHWDQGVPEEYVADAGKEADGSISDDYLFRLLTSAATNGGW